MGEREREREREKSAPKAIDISRPVKVKGVGAKQMTRE